MSVTLKKCQQENQFGTGPVNVLLIVFLWWSLFWFDLCVTSTSTFISAICLRGQTRWAEVKLRTHILSAGSLRRLQPACLPVSFCRCLQAWASVWHVVGSALHRHPLPLPLPLPAGPWPGKREPSGGHYMIFQHAAAATPSRVTYSGTDKPCIQITTLFTNHIPLFVLVFKCFLLDIYLLNMFYNICFD